MCFKLLASSVLLVSCFAPVLAAQSLVDATLNPDGTQVATPSDPVNAPGGPRLAAAGGADDFNRPDSTNMGPDWVEVSGDMGIYSNMGIGYTMGYMIHAKAKDQYAGSSASVDFLPSTIGTALVYTALIAGENPSGDFLFVKVQDNNSDGLYDTVWCYKNHNGGSWGASPYSFNLATPTPSGRMTLSFDLTGDVATLEIDNNFDTIIDETFAAGNILAAGLNLGTGFGIATWNNQNTYDNWVLNNGGGWKNIGNGVPGANGEPTLTLSGSPQVGTQPNLLATSSAVGPEQCLLFTGFTLATVPGFWGGSLYLVPAITVALPMPTAGWTLPLPIPNNPVLVGFIVYFQFLQSDPGAKLGAASSPALEMTIQP